MSNVKFGTDRLESRKPAANKVCAAKMLIKHSTWCQMGNRFCFAVINNIVSLTHISLKEFAAYCTVAISNFP